MMMMMLLQSLNPQFNIEKLISQVEYIKRVTNKLKNVQKKLEKQAQAQQQSAQTMNPQTQPVMPMHSAQDPQQVSSQSSWLMPSPDVNFLRSCFHDSVSVSCGTASQRCRRLMSKNKTTQKTADKRY